jgi:hypothetical protein
MIETMLLLILLTLCVILIAMPRSPLSAQEQCNRQFDALLARERILQQMQDEHAQATQRQARREQLLRPLYVWLGWLKHKLRWVPPTVAGLMVSSIPIYFIGMLCLR